MLAQLKACRGMPAQLKKEANEAYMLALEGFLTAELISGKLIYPEPENVFKALNTCQFNEYKVVIIGQDPYHGPGQANGLAFSVNRGQKIPPSLRNIYKELASDLNIEKAKHGDLNAWAKQGVLLLNSVLTVEASKPGSHQKKGWEVFSDKLIQSLSNKGNQLVFLLWGNHAKSKKQLIDAQKHLVLEANHPSPLSASRGFFDCKHFSKTNEYLIKNGKTPISWTLPD